MEHLIFEGLYYNFSSTPHPNLFFFDKLEQLLNNLTFDIKLHKHTKMHQFYFIESGEVDFYLDKEFIKVKAPAVLIIPNNIVHGFNFSKCSNGQVITIFTIVLDELIKESPMLCYFYNEPKIFKSIQKELFATVSNMINNFSEILITEKLEKQLMLKFKFGEILITLYREFCNTSSHTPLKYSSGFAQFNKFKKLLLVEKSCNKTIDYLASRLGITKVKLNRICKAVTGKSTLWFINESIINEARLKLIFTEKTISEIAYELNFTTPNYFSRFFKKQTGLTPKEFKEKYINDFRI